MLVFGNKYWFLFCVSSFYYWNQRAYRAVVSHADIIGFWFADNIIWVLSGYDAEVKRYDLELKAFIIAKSI